MTAHRAYSQTPLVTNGFETELPTQVEVVVRDFPMAVP